MKMQKAGRSNNRPAFCIRYPGALRRQEPVKAVALGHILEFGSQLAQRALKRLSGVLPPGMSADMEDLWQVVRSIQEAAQEAGVEVATGDTKVVGRGKGDGVFINTTGLGLIPPGIHISPLRARPGNAVLISGAIAVHGIAILSVREGLEFETTLESDTAPLNGLVEALLGAVGPEAHVLRDPTRGGVSSALNEIASSAGVGIVLEETGIPLWDEVKGACEILGLDPLYVANEGKCLAIVAPEAAEAALEAMRSHPLGREAAIIGQVVEEHPGTVTLRSRVGGKRVMDMLSGEQLPRIC